MSALVTYLSRSVRTAGWLRGEDGTVTEEAVSRFDGESDSGASGTPKSTGLSFVQSFFGLTISCRRFLRPLRSQLTCQRGPTDAGRARAGQELDARCRESMETQAPEWTEGVGAIPRRGSPHDGESRFAETLIRRSAAIPRWRLGLFRLFRNRSIQGANPRF